MTIRHALVAACVAGTVVVLPAQQARSYLVTVTDDAHKPVTGLGAEDFAIKDGGARQPVISAEPATGPLAVDILVADWMEAAPPARVERAAAELIQGADTANIVQASDLSVEGPYGMTPFATPPPPPDPRKYPLSVTDGVFDRAPVLGGTSAARRALLLIVNAPATLREYAAHSASDLLSRLRAANASLWVVDLAPLGTLQNDQLDALIASSGGLHISVKDHAGLSAAARDIATLLTTSQYIVTASVAAMATGPLPLATRHDRGIILIPAWSR